jgi:nucleoside-diphosphate-sugar epimerase
MRKTARSRSSSGNLKTMRCFVTGGGGFIGSRATRQMLADGWDVAVLAFPGESLWRIDDIRSRVQVLEADLSQGEIIADFLSSLCPDACLHTAWYAEPGKYLEATKNVDCMKDSLSLLENLIAAGCKNVVMLGSCAEYDSDAGFLKEDGPVRPATLYAATKLATSLVAERLAARAGMKFCWARMFYLFGPDEDPRRMVPAVIKALLESREFLATEGSQIRDYLHVDDAASALVTLLREGASGVFNVCSGEPVTVRRIMQMIGEAIGCPDLLRFGAIPYRNWEPPFICGDSSRLRRLGWAPRRELRDSLRLTIEHWRSKGSGKS